MRVDVFSIRGPEGYAYKRGDHIARAMCEGLARHGVQHALRTSFDGVQADVAIAYGWIHADVLKAHPQFAYWDLGYWNRRPLRAPQDGAHRLSFNSWDTADHMPRGMPADRFEASGIELLRPAPRSSDIALIAGMSAKSARVHGYGLDAWERQAATIARARGWRAVLRPKAPRVVIDAIETALMHCGLLVTHHSNCAVDAIIAGVPVWALRGVGRLVSPADCPQFGNAMLLGEAARRAIMADVAYAQWTVDEMRSGAAWEFMRAHV